MLVLRNREVFEDQDVKNALFLRIKQKCQKSSASSTTKHQPTNNQLLYG